MIAKTYIVSNLNHLDRLFTGTPSPKKAEYYSKLALLEFGGWVEMTMDEIVKRLGKRLISEKSNRVILEKEVIKRTYGFEYEQHFRKMLMNVIGLGGVEKVESLVDKTKFIPMVSTLKTLKSVRDPNAHAYLKKLDMTKRLDAPSLIKVQWNYVYEGLVDIDGILRNIKSPLHI